MQMRRVAWKKETNAIKRGTGNKQNCRDIYEVATGTSSWVATECGIGLAERKNKKEELSLRTKPMQEFFLECKGNTHKQMKTEGQKNKARYRCSVLLKKRKEMIDHG